MHTNRRQILLRLFHCGIDAVKGDVAVKNWAVRAERPIPTHILAVGKAALSMFEGCDPQWRTSVPSLLISKLGHIGAAASSQNVMAIEAEHPVPGRNSIAAGQAALEFVSNCSADSNLLMLVSGGASALVEHLKDGATFDDLIALTQGALKDGADIATLNARRKAISAIKGGQLLTYFKGAKATVLAISDVAGDGIDVIGSGIGACAIDGAFDYSAHILASNATARCAIEQAAVDLDMKVRQNDETMYADVADVARRISDRVNAGPNGLYVFGGEPTVVLPEIPGHGGRNQALALEFAKCISGNSGITGLVAGTDGTDGPTNAAGAFVDGATFHKQAGAEVALQRADSGSFLARTGDLILTGPTGTNVMDIALIWKHN